MQKNPRCHTHYDDDDLSQILVGVAFGHVGANVFILNKMGLRNWMPFKGSKHYIYCNCNWWGGGARYGHSRDVSCFWRIVDRSFTVARKNLVFFLLLC